MDERKAVLVRTDGGRRASAVTEYVESEMVKNELTYEACPPPEPSERCSIAKGNDLFAKSVIGKVVSCAAAKEPIPSLDYILIGTRSVCQGLKMGKRLFEGQAKKHGWALYEIYTDENEHQIKKRTANVLSEIQNKNNNKGRKTMKTRKEIKAIIEAINQSEDKSRSVRENMIQYCISAESMTEEDAAKIVDDIIKGTSDFTESLKDIHGKTKDEISSGLSERLNEKLKDLPSEDIDKILQNLFTELSALSIDRMNELASSVGDDDLKDMVMQIRRDCKASLEGKTYEEKLALISEAVQNCGSLSALLTLSVDNESFASATDIDDAISTATLNGAETAYIVDELGSLRNNNYTALAEYISAQHGTNPKYDGNASAYEIGVTTAADSERKKIKSAALSGMITFDNAVKLLGTIVGVALSLLLIWFATCFIIGLVAGLTGATTISTYLFTIGAISLMTATGGWDGVKERGKKIGNVLAKPIIWIKNLAIKLFHGFCRIFNIPLPRKKDGTTYEAEEDISFEDEEVVETDVETVSVFEDDEDTLIDEDLVTE